MSIEVQKRLRHLTRVLRRIESLQEEQIRLENERDHVLSKLRKFDTGEIVVFEDKTWEVGSITARLSAGIAQVYLRLHRGKSRFNPKQTRTLGPEQQNLCQRSPQNKSL